MELRKIQQIIFEASKQSTPLPENLLQFNIEHSSRSDAPMRIPLTSAMVRHFKSPLPPAILDQCLHMFQINMGEMYSQSSWGLKMHEKRKELIHDEARFLIVLEDGAALNSTRFHFNADTMVHSTRVPEVIGFAHFRYETDDEDDPQAPVTYLYELQIHQHNRNLGLGKHLMMLIELISLKFRINKVILTVFKVNEKAMDFYLNKMKYCVDHCSPSNFEGEDNMNCDYEILSKSLVSPGGVDCLDPLKPVRNA